MVSYDFVKKFEKIGGYRLIPITAVNEPINYRLVYKDHYWLVYKDHILLYKDYSWQGNVNKKSCEFVIQKALISLPEVEIRFVNILYLPRNDAEQCIGEY